MTVDLINQFYALVETSPRTYEYLRPWNNIHNGVDLDAANCMAAQGAIAGRVQSGFTRTFSPGDIRNHQGDFNGGIGHSDVQVAFGNLGIPAFIDEAVDWAGSWDWLRQRRFVWYGVQYDKVPRQNQAQKGGTFDHALGLFNPYPDNTVDMFDSLAKTIQRVTQSVVRSAAEALAVRVRHDASKLFVGATIPVPLDAVTLRYGAVKTKRQPDRTRAKGHNGDPVNVHSKPFAGSSSVVGTLPDGELFFAYQITSTGGWFEGSRVWLGNKTGTRWVAYPRLSHVGGST